MEFDNRVYFGFAGYSRLADGRWALRFNWRRIAAALVVLVALSYLAFGALLLWRDRAVRELEDARYAEMLLYPFSQDVRRSRRAAYSDALIEDAKLERDPRRALMLVRAGLMQNATNPEGRIFFSYALFLQRRSREALEFLREGLPFALTHPDYVSFFVRQCLAYYEDDFLTETEAEFRGNAGLSERNRSALAFGAAQAALLRGRLEELEGRLAAEPVAGTSGADYLRAQLMQARGDYAGATEQLMRIGFRNDSKEIDLQVAQNLIAAGEEEAALDFLENVAAADDVPAATRIRALDAAAGIDGNPRADALRETLVDDFFEDCGGNAGELCALASFAADSRDLALARRCWAAAREALFPNLADFQLAYVETLLRCGEYGEAVAELDAIARSEAAEKFLGKEAVIFGLRAAAMFAAGDGNLGEMFLGAALADARLSVPQNAALARALFDVGRRDKAFLVLERALGMHPEHPLLIEHLADFALRSRDAAAFVKYAPRLENSRRPPFNFLQECLAFARSDALIFFPERANVIAALERMTDA